MCTVDRFLEAKQQRDRAQAALQAMAEQLQAIATKLAHPEEGIGIRGDQYFLPTPQSEAMVKHSDYPSWDQIASAIETFRRADATLADIAVRLSRRERELLEL